MHGGQLYQDTIDSAVSSSKYSQPITGAVVLCSVTNSVVAVVSVMNACNEMDELYFSSPIRFDDLNTWLYHGMPDEPT